MNNDTQVNIEPAKIHIGRLIETAIRSQGLSASWVAAQLRCDRTNVYDIIHREYIDTQLLLRISLLLNVDFFKYYSDYLKEQKNTPPCLDI